MENTFGMNIIPENEEQRLAVLNRYRILDTPSEKSFDSVVKLATEIFQVPVSLVSLVSAEEVFFKAAEGVGDLRCGDRGYTPCALGVLTQEVTVIENALAHPNLTNNPLVHGAFGLRFYAGAPLITHDGFIIGTVCLVDTAPRNFGKHDEAILASMARVVMEQIELRLANLLETEKQVTINKKLAASEQRMQNILDTMAEGVTIINKAGRMIYSNPMAQRILGLPENEIKKRTYNDSQWCNVRLDGSPLPDTSHPMTIMMATGIAVYDMEIGFHASDGEVSYISMNAAPIIDSESGEITGGIGTFMDVTNRRRLMQQKEEFISVASHELKTPITSLQASMQLLDRQKNNPSPEKFTKLIEQSNKSLQKLTKLVGNLLDANRISEGQLQLRKTTFTIADMISDCCHHIHTAGTHEIIVKGDKNLRIHADEQQIDQVVVNLVNNAVKYAPDSKHIYINIEKVDNTAKISVKDAGAGVPPEKVPHLFDRYYRADYSGIQFSGLGLGLYICAEIIKKHNGEIGVESEVGEGSTFWFTLPV